MPTYEGEYSGIKGKVETYKLWWPGGNKWTVAYSDGNLTMGGVIPFESEELALTHMSSGVTAVVIGKQISDMPELEEDSQIFSR